LFRVVLQGWLETALGYLLLPMTDESGQVIESAYTPASSAMVISAFLFAAAHLPQQNADPIPLFIVALVLGYLYQRTHRIWPGVVLHATLNGVSVLMLIFLPSNQA
jgi:membrane protease YdiL (CAAX protease family)